MKRTHDSRKNRQEYRAREARRLRTLITPEGVALPLVIAARSARAGALMVDILILGCSTIAITVLLMLGLLGSLSAGSQMEHSSAGEFVLVVWSIMWFAAWNGYFIYFEMGPRGATPGKRMVGIRVASHDGGRLTPEAVVARNLLRDIELFLPLVLLSVAPTGEGGAAGWAALAWFVVFLAFPFFNKDALRAGDLVAGTWVVETPRSRLADTLSSSGTVATHTSEVTGTRYRFGPDELAVYGEFELQTLERILREDRPQAIEAVAETICTKIGWTPGRGDERAFLEAFYAQLRARLENDMRFGKRKADKFS